MYGITRKIGEEDFEEVRDRTEERLSEHGFGVLSEINVQEKLEKKLDVQFQDYTILGACSPSHAYEVLNEETKLGLLLPCNVIIYREEGEVYVSAVDPEKLLEVAENDDLEPVAEEIREKLVSVVEEVQG